MHRDAMLLSLLLLPFVILASPLNAPIKFVAHNRNGTEFQSNKTTLGFVVNDEEVCSEAAKGEHFRVEFVIFQIKGYYEQSMKDLSICADLYVALKTIHLAHCQGAIKQGEDMGCELGLSGIFTGSMRFYIKNNAEVWLHLDAKTFFHKEWHVDFKLFDLPHASSLGDDTLPTILPQPSPPPYIAVTQGGASMSTLAPPDAQPTGTYPTPTSPDAALMSSMFVAWERKQMEKSSAGQTLPSKNDIPTS
ncbi:MAG: hypothetical protein Q9163_002535 [Psora crenata]